MMYEKTKRLSKKMSELGICSRREADSYIKKGWVIVNGKTAIIGQKVNDDDYICLNPMINRIQNQKLTVIINKPIGYVSSQPEKNYRSVQDLIIPENFWQHHFPKDQLNFKNLKGLAPAGRLDIDSTGLLVLTQDGRIAKHIINDDNTIEKEYLVKVTGKLIKNGLSLLNHGLVLDNEPLQPAQITQIQENQFKFILTQGKKRQIRRMCELVGLKVTHLKRVRIGKIHLGNLPLGQWRFLKENEFF